MNISRKKAVICLICFAIHFLLCGLSPVYMLSPAIPIILCSLLCGFPWGPVTGIAAELLYGLIGGGILYMHCIIAIAVLITSLIPALLSHKTGTNLSAQSAVSATMTALTVCVSAAVYTVGTYMAVWGYATIKQFGMIAYDGIAFRLMAMVIAIAVTTLLTLMLCRNKRDSFKTHRSADDER